jgi:hypothetical protein
MKPSDYPVDKKSAPRTLDKDHEKPVYEKPKKDDAKDETALDQDRI